MHKTGDSMFAKYVAELAGQFVLERDYGFAWYEINGDTCYIKDVYIVADKRNASLTRDLEKEIIAEVKERGCKTLLGSVIPTNANSQKSLQWLLAMGYTLMSSHSNLIMFKKDI